IRDSNFLIYVVYVILFGFTLSCHTGFAFQYLWPDSVWWNKHSHTFFSAMIGFSMCLFCYFFLDLRTQAPRLGLLVLIPGSLASLVGIVSLSGFLLELAKINNALLILSTSLVYAAAWQVWAKGYKPARFFLLSFSLVIVTGIILLLGARGLVAVPQELTYVAQLGSAIEIILLSLGLGDRINVMRARTDLLEKEALRRETEIKQMEMELGVARQIQQSILPQGAPVLSGIRVAARYEPMQAVGGDFYDFYPVSNSMLCVLIADVSGHGIPAALIASMLKIAGAENVSRAESPSEFLLAINRVILGKQSDHFVTAGFGVIDISKRTLTYANAGHPPLLIQSKTGAIRRLRPLGRILGIFPNPSFAHETVELLDGDRIVFYTDGIIEASGEDFVQFGQERVEMLLTEFINRSPEELSDALLQRLHDWTGATSLDDDVTFVIVDIGPEAGAISEGIPEFV
ncbi:MAG: SpoIIE family protein phosphatase, partial [Leptospirales bacterium]|nr:SpoIIE family protein phosphatase [Leptospirales bacterium]